MRTFEPPDNWPDSEILHDLILHFPEPIALFNATGEILVQNDKCKTICRDQNLTKDILRSFIRGAHRAGNKPKAKIVRSHGIGMLILHETDGEEHAANIERLNAEIAKLQKLSTVDTLTGAWNRAQFDKMASIELERSKRTEQPISLILFDIDHFKSANDNYGHQCGDKLLYELVKVIAALTRSVDMLFRWGGEEFAVLTPATGYQAAATLAERIRKEISEHEFPEVGQVTISAGVAERLAGEELEAWFRRVDEALYSAKRDGRNRVIIDRRGNSDLAANQTGASVVRLVWKPAYECGEPTIDAQHRELFNLGNALFDATMESENEPEAFLTALHGVISHLTKHFIDEETILSARGYEGTHRHQAIHAALIARANEIEIAARSGNTSLGALVEFLADTFISKHLLNEDRKFFDLFSERQT